MSILHKRLERLEAQLQSTRDTSPDDAAELQAAWQRMQADPKAMAAWEALEARLIATGIHCPKDATRAEVYAFHDAIRADPQTLRLATEFTRHLAIPAPAESGWRAQ